MMVNEICEKKYNKPLSGCTNEEIYYALLDMTKDLAAKKESEAGKKKVYYISAEFLIGKLLSNNLINLGLYKTVKKSLKQQERILVRSKRSSQNHLLETVDLAVWQHAFWTPWQH